MYIEGHWENVDSLQDIAKIIREYYNPELADAMEELIPDNICSEEDLEELESLRDIMSEIRGLVN